MASKTYVDYGNTTADFGFHFNTSDMKAGDTKYLHFSPEDVLAHVGVVNADLINAHKMDITSTKTNGLFGISAYNDDSMDDDWIKTSNSVAVKGNFLDAQHHHVNVPNANHTNSIFLRPTHDQSIARNEMTNRKAIPTWAGMTSANVKAGVFVSKLGDEERYIVTPGATDKRGNITCKSALHAYITRNKMNPAFAGGYFKNTPTTSYNGQEGIVVPKKMFEPMHKTISDMVETHSGFSKGFGLALTKLCDQPTSAPMNARVVIHRTPMSKTEGISPLIDSAVTESHVRTLVNGGAPVTEVEADAAAVVAPGFEKEIMKKGVDASTYKIVPFDGSESQ